MSTFVFIRGGVIAVAADFNATQLLSDSGDLLVKDRVGIVSFFSSSAGIVAVGGEVDVICSGLVGSDTRESDVRGSGWHNVVGSVGGSVEGTVAMDGLEFNLPVHADDSDTRRRPSVVNAVEVHAEIVGQDNSRSSC